VEAKHVRVRNFLAWGTAKRVREQHTVHKHKHELCYLFMSSCSWTHATCTQHTVDSTHRHALLFTHTLFSLVGHQKLRRRHSWLDNHTTTHTPPVVLWVWLCVALVHWLIASWACVLRQAMIRLWPLPRTVFRPSNDCSWRLLGHNFGGIWDT